MVACTNPPGCVIVLYDVLVKQPCLLDAYDTICLTLKANDGKIKGRTVIQKLIYFEMQKIPELDIEPHIAYFYGPFNRQVAQGLETLVHLDVLSERQLRKENFYEYAILDKGISAIEQLIKDNKNTYETIKSIIQTCREYCRLKPNPLSLAAKTHYMLTKRECERGMTKEELAGMARDFGWNITEKDVKSGADLLQQLGLVKIK